MDKPKFYPPPAVKLMPLKFYRSDSAHATISWTSTPVPNYGATVQLLHVQLVSKYMKYYDCVTVDVSVPISTLLSLQP